MVVGKVCKKCLVWKELDGFQKHVSCKRDGHKWTCKACDKIYSQRRNKEKKEEIRLKSKEYHEKMKNDPAYIKMRKDYQERNKAAKSEYDKKYRSDNEEKINLYKKKYGEENKEKISASKRIWRANNKDVLKKYREENKEKIAELNKKYWSENKEAQKERVNEWRKENAEHIKMYRVANRERDKKKAQEWHASERGKILRATMTNRYRAKKKLLKRDFTSDDWVSCMEHFCYQCAYCGRERKLEQEHVIPVTKGGAFTKSNIVPACRNCNVTKSNKDFAEWYRSHEKYSVEREKRILKYLGVGETERIF